MINKFKKTKTKSGEGQSGFHIPIRAILVSQVIFTSLFLFKILADYFSLPLYIVPWTVMEIIEITASIGMLLGVFTSFVLVSQGQERVESVERQN